MSGGFNVGLLQMNSQEHFEDPWGDILVEADEEVGVIVATVEPDMVKEVRQMIPSLTADLSY